MRSPADQLAFVSTLVVRFPGGRRCANSTRSTFASGDDVRRVSTKRLKAYRIACCEPETRSPSRRSPESDQHAGRTLGTSDTPASSNSRSNGTPVPRSSGPSLPVSTSVVPASVYQDIPGPRPLPVVGNALDIIGMPLSELMLRYAREHGVFLKFSIVSDVLYLVSDPVLLQHVVVTNSRNYLDRWTPPGFGPLLYDGRLKGLVFSQSTYWMKHRQLVSSVFRSRAFLSHFVSVAAAHSHTLVDEVWRISSLPSFSNSSSAVVNVHQAMRMLTLDVIGTAAFGTSFNAMQAGSHPIEQSLDKVLHGVLDVIKSPIPLWRVMRTPKRAIVDDNLATLQAIERQLIHQRREALNRTPRNDDSNGSQNFGEKDFLAILLKARDSNIGEFFQDDDLMWDVHDVIFAGHETTSSALAAALWLIMGSPRVLGKILAELEEVLGDRHTPGMEDLSRLQYLEMVCNEALRMYPPTALVGRIAKEKDRIGGYEIPAGSNVLTSPYVMGRLSRLWGEDVDEFRPERFDETESASRHSLAFFPFGAGPRGCLGMRMAMLQMKTVLAVLLSKVSFKRTSDELGVNYDSTVSFSTGMDMRISCRDA